jgi:hypothetical protein
VKLRVIITAENLGPKTSTANKGINIKFSQQNIKIRNMHKNKNANTTTGQPALGMLSDRRPPKGFKPAYSTRIQASIPTAS